MIRSRTLPLLVAAPLALAIAILPLAQAQQAPAAAAQAGASGTYTQQDLDELLAPIALYPDALLAQVLMASTYPLEIVEAARWSKANAGLTGKALEDAMQNQSWDPSVKALTAVPQVLAMMSEKLDWTQKLGDAFLAQQDQVMKTAQSLRAKAEAAGNLKSTPEQTVKTDQQAGQTVYVIESAKPEVIYVPTYNPAIIYGTWWYPYPPPYYYYPPGYVAGAGFWFATGVIVGGAIWGGCHWGRNEVNINVNKYNSFNRTNISTNDWKHNVEHRKGVAYKDKSVAQKYNRGGDARAVESREQFRGRAEQGRAELQGMDRSQLQGQVQQADRARAGDRAGQAGDRMATGDRAGAGGGGLGASASPSRDFSGAGNRASPGGQGMSRDVGGGRGGGFSGAGSGASTRAASSRGGASRGSMGGGGGGRRR